MGPMPFTDEEKRLALTIARQSIHHGLTRGRPLEPETDGLPESLRRERASFVTLHKAGQLRGCIGTIDACLPLARDIALRAWSAAFQDRRFPRLEAEEFDHLELSVSVLTAPEPLPFRDHDDLVDKIAPGEDGLILEQGYRRGVFLPSVWESLPDKREFLRHLEMKAGLPVDDWRSSRRVYRFRTEYFSEGEMGRAA